MNFYKKFIKSCKLHIHSSTAIRMNMFSWNRRACLPVLITIRTLEDSPSQLNTATTISSFKPCFHGDGLYLMRLISHQTPTDIKSLNSIHNVFTP